MLARGLSFLTCLCLAVVTHATTILLNTNKTIGTAYFAVQKNQGFKWTVTSPNKEKDVLLVLTIIYVTNYQSGKYIYLPDGNLLVYKAIEYKYPDDAWCGVYVPQNSKACTPGQILKSACNKPANVSTQWPPVVTGRGSNNFYVQFIYTYLPCDSNSAGNSGSDSQSQCDPMIGTFAILGVLLTISVLLSTALLVKAIRDKRKKETRPEQKPQSNNSIHQRSALTSSGRSRANTPLPPINPTYQTPYANSTLNSDNEYQGLSAASENSNLVYNQLER